LRWSLIGSLVERKECSFRVCPKRKHVVGETGTYVAWMTGHVGSLVAALVVVWISTLMVTLGVKLL
jgi:hypothetical protein